MSRRSRKPVPVSGTSVGLMILRICSIDCKSGESPKRKPLHFDWFAKEPLDLNGDVMPPARLLPPWQQKIFSSMMAAIGRQLKQSVKVFHSFMLNLRLPGGGETQSHPVGTSLLVSTSVVWFHFTHTRRRNRRCG